MALPKSTRGDTLMSPKQRSFPYCALTRYTRRSRYSRSATEDRTGILTCDTTVQVFGYPGHHIEFISAPELGHLHLDVQVISSSQLEIL